MDIRYLTKFWSEFWFLDVDIDLDVDEVRQQDLQTELTGSEPNRTEVLFGLIR